jgi:hypothetical protein
MQILKNILAFNGLGIGVPASQPHLLNRGDGITTPRLLAADAAGFTIIADALNVTVTRTTGGASVNVYAELWHTLEDAEPYPGLAPTSFPFVIDANGGGGGGAQAVVFDDAVPAAQMNIRSARALNQSPIDNTKAGITNLGSSTVVTAGATGAYATIGGGDGNVVAGDYATVPGGANCVASGRRSFAAGYTATATGDAAAALGDNCFAIGDHAVALGYGSVARGTAAAALGIICVADGPESIALGNGCQVTSTGDNAAALGANCIASGRAAIALGHICQATGQCAAALGHGCVASGEDAVALGTGTYATADRSFATGVNSVASRAGQHAYASSPAFPPGVRQTSVLVMNAATPGLAINETDALKVGTDLTLTLEDDKAYAIEVTAVVGGVQGGGSRVARTISLSFVARRAAGVTAIAASGVGEAFGDATTSTWTIVPTVGAAPDRIVLEFGTGAGIASACTLAARVEFTEVLF